MESFDIVKLLNETATALSLEIAKLSGRKEFITELLTFYENEKLLTFKEAPVENSPVESDASDT